MQGSVHTGPALTPAEVLIAIHGIDPERDHIPLPMVVLSTITAFKMFFWSPKKPIIESVAFICWLPLQSYFVYWSYTSVSICNILGCGPQNLSSIFFKYRISQNVWTPFLPSIRLKIVPLCQKHSIVQETLRLFFMTFNHYLFKYILVT